MISASACRYNRQLQRVARGEVFIAPMYRRTWAFSPDSSSRRVGTPEPAKSPDISSAIVSECTATPACRSADMRKVVIPRSPTGQVRITPLPLSCVVVGVPHRMFVGLFEGLDDRLHDLRIGNVDGQRLRAVYRAGTAHTSILPSRSPSENPARSFVSSFSCTAARSLTPYIGKCGTQSSIKSEQRALEE